MRMEFVLIALLLAAAFVGARRMKPENKHIDPEEAALALKRAKGDEDHRFFREHFCECFFGMLSGMIRYQSTASNALHCAWVNRHLSERCIRFIEEQLADQDENGVTLKSTVEVALRLEKLRNHEADFIRFQQSVHADVEKLRDHIFHMQKLAEPLAEWKAEKSFVLQNKAEGLIERIEKEAGERWKATEHMLTEADREPVGNPHAAVTPKVTEFRTMLAELRSKIRTDLAAKAKTNS